MRASPNVRSRICALSTVSRIIYMMILVTIISLCLSMPTVVFLLLNVDNSILTGRGIIIEYHNNATFHTEETEETEEIEKYTYENKLQNLYMDGWKCRYIYIDLGSNVGVQPRKVFEPEKYPATMKKIEKVTRKNQLLKTIKHFNTYLGDDIDDRRKNCCVFGFEANPNHAARLNEIERCYDKQGWKIHFNIKAVLDTDDEIVEVVNAQDDGNEAWGARIDPLKGGGQSIMRNKKLKKALKIIEVETIDIANWIWNLIKYHAPTNILIKMDIEGAEFKVLPRMLEKGILCQKYISFMQIELHHSAQERMEANFNLTQMLDKIQTSQECEATEIREHDDESYLHDGEPLPC